MIDEIRRQFELGWALTALHLASLVEADFLWEPAELCWTVRPDPGGQWRADFAEVEPDPVPVPTIAWLTHRRHHPEWARDFLSSSAKVSSR